MKLTENQIRRIVKQSINEIHEDLSNEVLKAASNLGLDMSNPSLKNAIHWLIKSRTKEEFDKTIQSMVNGLNSYSDGLKHIGTGKLSNTFLKF